MSITAIILFLIDLMPISVPVSPDNRSENSLKNDSPLKETTPGATPRPETAKNSKSPIKFENQEN